MIIEMIDDIEKRDELISRLNEHLSFRNYIWVGYPLGITLTIPGKWLGNIITITFDNIYYRFQFFLSKEQNSELETIMSLMISILGLIESEKSKKHPEYLKREYYLPRKYQI
jgi:hypothetical protein